MTPIERMINGSLKCAKCGTAGVGNCRCWILLRCERCGQKKTVARMDHDPPSADVCSTGFCNKCESGGEFDMVTYYDAAGNEVSGDPETFATEGAGP